MIRKLKGIVDEIEANGLVVDVNGVGYFAHCPLSVLESEIAVGQEITLWVETQMSEHALTLYGFISTEQLNLFRLLNTVPGVGSKAALAIIGSFSNQTIAGAIVNGSATLLAKSPGIGKKLAERIVAELKDKIPPSINNVDSFSATQNGNIVPLRKNLSGAVSALVNLGYTENIARAAVSKVTAANENQSIEETLRACLRELAR